MKGIVLLALLPGCTARNLDVPVDGSAPELASNGGVSFALGEYDDCVVNAYSTSPSGKLYGTMVYQLGTVTVSETTGILGVQFNDPSGFLPTLMFNFSESSPPSLDDVGIDVPTSTIHAQATHTRR